MSKCLSVFIGVAAAFVALALPVHVAAQELNCRVNVDIQQLQGTEFEYLRSQFREQVEAYLNTQSWTENTFLPEERIECTVYIVFNGNTGMNDFNAQITVQTLRPVYGSTSQVQVFQHQDGNWAFTYVRNQPLARDLNRFEPLSSVLDFYALLMIGFDYDTFSELGGTPMFEKAERVVALAESGGGAGWSALGEERTRGAIVQQLLAARMQPLRAATYAYHFGGLDHFLTEPDQARLVIVNALSEMQTVFESQNRRPYLLDIFLTSKVDEIVALFERSPYASQVLNALMTIDPSRSSRYEPLQG